MKPDPSKKKDDYTYLRELLTQAGMSQRAAARMLGIPERTFRGYLTGEHPFPYIVQYALECALLDCEKLDKLIDRLENGRHFLMSSPKEVTPEECLEAFGWSRNGLEEVDSG